MASDDLCDAVRELLHYRQTPGEEYDDEVCNGGCARFRRGPDVLPLDACDCEARLWRRVRAALPTLTERVREPGLRWSEEESRKALAAAEALLAQAAHDREVWDAAVTACVAKMEGWSWAMAVRDSREMLADIRALLGGPKEGI